MRYLYILKEFEYLAWVVAQLVVEMLDRKTALESCGDQMRLEKLNLVKYANCGILSTEVVCIYLPVMIFSSSTLSFIDVIVYVTVLFAIKHIYYELTTGAARRAIIKDNGCKPVYHWRHQGLLGKLLGLDIIQQQIKDDKAGRTFEGARQRFFKDRNTVQTRSLGIESKSHFGEISSFLGNSSLPLLQC